MVPRLQNLTPTFCATTVGVSITMKNPNEALSPEESHRYALGGSYDHSEDWTGIKTPRVTFPMGDTPVHMGVRLIRRLTALERLVSDVPQ
jgi:hypothetical protein